MSPRGAISNWLIRIADGISPPQKERDAIGFRLPTATTVNDLYHQPYGLPLSHIDDE